MADGPLGVSADTLRRLRRGVQVAVAGIIAYAVVSVDVGLAINAGLALVTTFLPEILRRRYDVSVGNALALSIAVAGLLHAVGALGPYKTIPWFDQVAHAVSASLVAGAGYAIVIALDRSSAGVDFPSEFRAAFILIFTLAFGVLWEIAEFTTGGVASLVGGATVLAQYGMDDIVLDLVFDAAGAVLVAVWGTDFFRGLAHSLVGRVGLLRDRG